MSASKSKAAQERQIKAVVNQSVLWKQVSPTNGRDYTYHLYFSDDAARRDTLMKLMKIKKGENFRFSSDEVGDTIYPTLRISDTLAQALTPYYQEAKHYVGASPKHGGVRLSTTAPGEHARQILETALKPQITIGA